MQFLLAIIKSTVKKCFIVILLAVTILSSGCNSPSGRYHHKNDSSPLRIPKASELHDAIPRAEKPSRGGNKHYSVRGKYYKVLSSAKGFTETGIASWYGRKFHGYFTSNGEVYDMYAMSAAHKHLPLPTYVKVVNNDNGKSVIVRVNDRGPFHPNRIIDLSYSAAYKLDMIKKGTANVTITALTNFDEKGYFISATSPEKTVTTPRLHKPLSGKYIQLFASKNKQAAIKQKQLFIKNIAKTSLAATIEHVHIHQQNNIYKVLFDAINSANKKTLSTSLKIIKANGYPAAFIKSL